MKCHSVTLGRRRKGQTAAVGACVCSMIQRWLQHSTHLCHFLRSHLLLCVLKTVTQWLEPQLTRHILTLCVKAAHSETALCRRRQDPEGSAKYSTSAQMCCLIMHQKLLTSPVFRWCARLSSRLLLIARMFVCTGHAHCWMAKPSCYLESLNKMIMLRGHRDKMTLRMPREITVVIEGGMEILPTESQLEQLFMHLWSTLL